MEIFINSSEFFEEEYQRQGSMIIFNHTYNHFDHKILKKKILMSTKIIKEQFWQFLILSEYRITRDL